MKKGIFLILLLGLLACSQEEVEPSPSSDNNQVTYCEVGNDDCESENNADYESIISSDTFISIDFETAVSMLKNKESGIFYFGYPDCPWCLEALPIMQETAASLGQNIYYVATRDEERNVLYSDEEVDIILEYVGEYEDTDEEGNLHLYVPLVVKVNNGEVVGGNLGTVEGHDAHERKMTEEEKKQLSQIYLEMFEK